MKTPFVVILKNRKLYLYDVATMERGKELKTDENIYRLYVDVTSMISR